jgi:hypothetical protein
MEKKYPIGEVRIYFVFKHAKTGEEMSSKLYTPLELLDTDLSIINERTCVCDCKPVGETNVVECNCEDYYQDFQFHSYHVEQATPQGIGWVKASERLPAENGRKYFVKFREGKYICHYYNGWFQSTEWGLMDNSLIEWLDESAQPGREVEFAEWAKEQAWQCKKGVGWMKHSDETPYVMTTAELFDLYKTPNP